MWEWFTSPVDPARVHEVGAVISWHGRVMVLGWGILAPLAVLVARFFKILPSQNWPTELDSKIWWRTHWIAQTIVFALSIAGLLLVLPSDFGQLSLHGWIGYLVLTGLFVQVLLGVARGSKGGPTSPSADGSPRGHHYDMTPWRRTFEALHKAIGYGVLLLAMVAILFGLWKANALMWMVMTLLIWWALLVVLFIQLQARGMAVDTYQAIWGNDLEHPGNQMDHPGWGVRRPGDDLKGANDVRDDRRDGLRGH